MTVLAIIAVGIALYVVFSIGLVLFLDYLDTRHEKRNSEK